MAVTFPKLFAPQKTLEINMSDILIYRVLWFLCVSKMFVIVENIFIDSSIELVARKEVLHADEGLDVHGPGTLVP